MLKKTSVLSCCLIAMACSATPEELGENEQGAVVEQEFQAPIRGPHITFGTRTTVGNVNCDDLTPAQTCVVPATRALRYSISCSLGAATCSVFTTAVTQAVSRVINQGLNWPSSQVAVGAANETVRFVASTVAIGAGPASNNMKDFVAVTGATTALTEAAGVVGQYVKRPLSFVSIDANDVIARGTTAAQDQNFMTSSVANGLLKALGIGGVEASNFRCSSNSVTNILPNACIISSNEICALNGFVVNDTTSYANSQTNCGA